MSRYHQQRRTVPGLLAAGKSLISDYTFAKDSLFARINLKGDELDMYYKVHEALGEKIPRPDLIVYLRASTTVLMQRIASRDRPYERNMEHDYIDRLNGAYESFFARPYDSTPVLVVDTNTLNIVQNQADLKLIGNLDSRKNEHESLPAQPAPRRRRVRGEASSKRGIKAAYACNT